MSWRNRLLQTYHFIGHAYIARKRIEVGCAAQDTILFLLKLNWVSRKLSFISGVAPKGDFNTRIAYLTCVYPTVRTLFGSGVYADQLVFGIRAVECEVEIQTAVEELPTRYLLRWNC